MPVVFRFKGHDDFEESCYRLGIPWVPPQVLKMSLKLKTAMAKESTLWKTKGS